MMHIAIPHLSKTVLRESGMDGSHGGRRPMLMFAAVNLRRACTR
jgi:hypothetical protein